MKYAQNKHEHFATKVRRKFRRKFRRTSSTPSAWLEIKISPLLSKLRRVQVGRFQHPATLLQRRSQTHELVDILPHRPFLGGLIQDLVYLSEVDRIFNLGQVGPCSTLSRYGYRGKTSSGQWTCPSVTSKAKMRVTEKMGQKLSCHKRLKTEL